ncbi:hypothetical protein VOLCADRAFT_91049 [Volvox carteri f. nagariensis]|uniref:Uncharacterized protein n=1 Tax=Volvox carteri f. nagariensis TaxID=3068 RepID=D8TW18_VOLCA|nr:uncharacterized protein VOLCADRAFT_91049 [Volvox carteri f. nagariensis]EFJ48402.1 hypothetical protein VOLCADRAFT_91049 [Volvox carteri f. nagariensis]|eukprot:XP_002950656.1 hypothetical protein VOLCADRAFT_91049 [Volvox carteri f. nagariensis]
MTLHFSELRAAGECAHNKRHTDECADSTYTEECEDNLLKMANCNKTAHFSFTAGFGHPPGVVLRATPGIGAADDARTASNHMSAMNRMYNISMQSQMTWSQGFPMVQPSLQAMPVMQPSEAPQMQQQGEAPASKEAGRGKPRGRKPKATSPQRVVLKAKIPRPPITKDAVVDDDDGDDKHIPDAVDGDSGDDSGDQAGKRAGAKRKRTEETVAVTRLCSRDDDAEEEGRQRPLPRLQQAFPNPSGAFRGTFRLVRHTPEQINDKAADESMPEIKNRDAIFKLKGKCKRRITYPVNKATDELADIRPSNNPADAYVPRRDLGRQGSAQQALMRDRSCEGSAWPSTVVAVGLQAPDALAGNCTGVPGKSTVRVSPTDAMCMALADDLKDLTKAYREQNSCLDACYNAIGKLADVVMKLLQWEPVERRTRQLYTEQSIVLQKVEALNKLHDMGALADKDFDDAICKLKEELMKPLP